MSRNTVCPKKNGGCIVALFQDTMTGDSWLVNETAKIDRVLDRSLVFTFCPRCGQKITNKHITTRRNRL